MPLCLSVQFSPLLSHKLRYSQCSTRSSPLDHRLSTSLLSSRKLLSSPTKVNPASHLKAKRLQIDSSRLCLQIFMLHIFHRAAFVCQTAANECAITGMLVLFPVFVQSKIVYVGNFHMFLSNLLSLKVKGTLHFLDFD